MSWLRTVFTPVHQTPVEALYSKLIAETKLEECLQRRVIFVLGPIGAGKSTYICDHMSLIKKHVHINIDGYYDLLDSDAKSYAAARQVGILYTDHLLAHHCAMLMEGTVPCLLH